MLIKPPSFIHLFAEHQRNYQKQVLQLIEDKNLQCLVVGAGETHTYFQDDVFIPFRSCAFFRYFCPLEGAHHRIFWRKDQEEGHVLFYEPDSFWHAAHRAKELPFSDFFQLSTFSSLKRKWPTAITSAAAKKGRLVYIGPPHSPDLPDDRWECNPQDIIDELSRMRMTKSCWEVACLRQATQRALTGHRALRQRFLDQGNDLQQPRSCTEKELFYLFQQATGEVSDDFPYPPIIALDHHASFLHYDQRSHHSANQGYNLLVDAGVQCYGYASDISRTHLRSWHHRLRTTKGQQVSREAWSVFAHMLRGLDELGQKLVALAQPGSSFFHMHLQATEGIFALLKKAGIISSSTWDENMRFQVVRTFFPHGLGHMLGLQVHDVHIIPPSFRAPQAAIQAYSPRAHTPLKAGQVWTVEPGIYFIPRLLSSFSKKHPQMLNQKLLDELLPLGGMRIEDNILITSKEPVNLTREAIQKFFPDFTKSVEE